MTVAPSQGIPESVENLKKVFEATIARKKFRRADDSDDKTVSSLERRRVLA
jgi:hypothetical protein